MKAIEFARDHTNAASTVRQRHGRDIILQNRLIAGCGYFFLRDAAVSGIGVVQLPTMFIRDELTQGALIRVIPAWEPRPEIIHAVYASRRGQLPGVRALLDFLVLAFKELNER